MAQQTRSLRQQAQQEFAQSLDQLGADLDFGDDLWAELAQLPEVELAEPTDATFPEISGGFGGRSVAKFPPIVGWARPTATNHAPNN
jgi:hypothetical protein